ncbi:MAG: hypothetical protein QOF02_3188 [Blastocatellia bacterium]|jgi:hypothetical protein|nr:hypothetical protein [Blastocatellia bacterium]
MLNHRKGWMGQCKKGLLAGPRKSDGRRLMIEYANQE